MIDLPEQLIALARAGHDCDAKLAAQITNHILQQHQTLLESLSAAQTALAIEKAKAGGAQ